MYGLQFVTNSKQKTKSIRQIRIYKERKKLVKENDV